LPDCAEWGYIYLPELEEINAHNGLVIVERELNWEPLHFAEIPRKPNVANPVTHQAPL